MYCPTCSHPNAADADECAVCRTNTRYFRERVFIGRLFLPGNLALLKGGANAQTAHLPVEQAELTVDAIAVRPGRGNLYVSLHDMYDADKVGTIPGIEIIVK